MKTIYIGLYFIFISLAFFACSDGKRDERQSTITTIAEQGDTVRKIYGEYQEEVIHAKIKYYDFDKVENLTQFFDTIIATHGTMARKKAEEDPDLDFRLCIKQIEKYRKGDQVFYPDSLVSHCISTLGFECAYINNHRVGVDLTFSEWFIMCAAYYAPDITCLVDTQTPDHNAGYRNYGKNYNGSPWWSYMFVKQEKGFEMIKVDGEEVELTGVYQLEDTKHRTYYLFSNNENTSYFHQILFILGDNSTEKVFEIKEFPLEEGDLLTRIYFNTGENRWYQCDWETDPLQPIPGKAKIQLVLDEKNSSYRIIQ